MADRSDGWSVWLNEHGAALILLARQWVPSRADAEDVVQDAFVRFWRSKARTDDPILDPTAYLYGCVKHAALDRQRGRARQQRREFATARPEAEPLFMAPIEQAERRALIEEALLRLPQDQAEVLVMKTWGGLSFPQIAAAVGVSVHTAASRYRYALSKLRQQLAKEPIL